MSGTGLVAASSGGWLVFVALAIALVGAAVGGGTLIARVLGRLRVAREVPVVLDEQEELARAATGPTRQPLSWAFLMNWGQQGITTVVTFALAGILGPHVYGVVAIATIYISFIWLALDQGISTAIIQRENLEPEHLDSAFWMNMAWAVMLAGVSIAVSPWWARLNHSHELEGVIDVLSLGIPLQGLVLVQQSLLQRRVQFKKLALRSNVAALGGGAVGLALALGGAGIWSLVAQQMTFVGLSVVLLWAVGRWVPRFRFSKRHARDLLGFSVNVFSSNVAVFVNRRADALLMGIFFGPVPVAIYRLADRVVETLLTIATRPILAFTLPRFSRLQHDREKLRAAVSSCISLSFLTTVPLMLGMAACSPFLVRVLGHQWAPAANALKLLAIVGIGKSVVLFTGSLLFAVAKPLFRAVMDWIFAAASAATFTVVALALRGSHAQTQVLGMAASRVVLFLCIFLPVNAAIVAYLTGLSPRRLITALRWPLLSGLAAIAAVAGLRATGILSGRGPLWALFASSAVAALTAGGSLILFEPSVRRLAYDLWQRVQIPREAEPETPVESVLSQ